MTNIISKIEGTINTAVGKIKQNADRDSFDKEGIEQEKLGKSQLANSFEEHGCKNDS
jgi:uncharacterized protein YjbJ (UPF0337 family)